MMVGVHRYMTVTSRRDLKSMYAVVRFTVGLEVLVANVL